MRVDGQLLSGRQCVLQPFLVTATVVTAVESVSATVVVVAATAAAIADENENQDNPKT